MVGNISAEEFFTENWSTGVFKSKASACGEVSTSSVKETLESNSTSNKSESILKL